MFCRYSTITSKQGNMKKRSNPRWNMDEKGVKTQWKAQQTVFADVTTVTDAWRPSHGWRSSHLVTTVMQAKTPHSDYTSKDQFQFPQSGPLLPKLSASRSIILRGNRWDSTSIKREAEDFKKGAAFIPWSAAKFNFQSKIYFQLLFVSISPVLFVSLSFISLSILLIPISALL